MTICGLSYFHFMPAIQVSQGNSGKMLKLGNKTDPEGK